MREPTAASPRGPNNRVWNKPGNPPKKINRRALFLAIGLGLLAAILIVAYLSSRGASGDEVVVPNLQVVVASLDIEAGQQITEGMVELKGIPETAVLGNPATETSQVVGQALRYPVAKGEQLVNLRLVETATVQILSFQIPPGLRAFTIPVSVNTTPAALTAPGDFVDLLVSGPLDTLRTTSQFAALGSLNTVGATEVTGTLFQNVQVLAVQQSYVANGVPYDASVRERPRRKAMSAT